MKKVFIIFLMILLLVGCDKKQTDQKVIIHPSPYINDDELTKILEEGNYVIVDVRSPEEYKEGHIKSAINIPVDTINENVKLDKSKKILVYCRSGVRSNKAYETLTALGFDVYDMGAMDSIKLDKE